MTNSDILHSPHLIETEEERYILEDKFNHMMRMTRDAEQDRLRTLRHKYNRFIEEDRRRHERNNDILRSLQRIENRASSLAAKTDRFNHLRKQYAIYLKSQREKGIPKEKPNDRQEFNPTQHTFRRKLLYEKPIEESYDSKVAKSKINILEQYIRENNETEKYLDNINLATKLNGLNERSPETKNYDRFLEKVIGTDYTTTDSNLEYKLPQGINLNDLYNRKENMNRFTEKEIKKSPTDNEKLGYLLEKGMRRLQDFQLEKSMIENQGSDAKQINKNQQSLETKDYQTGYHQISNTQPQFEYNKDIIIDKNIPKIEVDTPQQKHMTNENKKILETNSLLTSQSAIVSEQKYKKPENQVEEKLISNKENKSPEKNIQEMGKNLISHDPKKNEAEQNIVQQKYNDASQIEEKNKTLLEERKEEIAQEGKSPEYLKESNQAQNNYPLYPEQTEQNYQQSINLTPQKETFDSNYKDQPLKIDHEIPQNYQQDYEATENPAHVYQPDQNIHQDNPKIDQNYQQVPQNIAPISQNYQEYANQDDSLKDQNIAQDYQPQNIEPDDQVQNIDQEYTEAQKMDLNYHPEAQNVLENYEQNQNITEDYQNPQNINQQYMETQNIDSNYHPEAQNIPENYETTLNIAGNYQEPHIDQQYKEPHKIDSNYHPTAQNLTENYEQTQNITSDYQKPEDIDPNYIPEAQNLSEPTEIMAQDYQNPQKIDQQYSETQNIDSNYIPEAQNLSEPAQNVAQDYQNPQNIDQEFIETENMDSNYHQEAQNLSEPVQNMAQDYQNPQNIDQQYIESENIDSNYIPEAQNLSETTQNMVQDYQNPQNIDQEFIETENIDSNYHQEAQNLSEETQNMAQDYQNPQNIDQQYIEPQNIDSNYHQEAQNYDPTQNIEHQSQEYQQENDPQHYPQNVDPNYQQQNIDPNYQYTEQNYDEQGNPIVPTQENLNPEYSTTQPEYQEGYEQYPDQQYDPNYQYDPNAQYDQNAGQYDPNYAPENVDGSQYPPEQGYQYSEEYSEQQYSENLPPQTGEQVDNIEQNVSEQIAPSNVVDDSSSLQSVGNIDGILGDSPIKDIGQTGPETKVTNLAKLLDSETESSLKLDATKVSNDSDFDFSNE